jgi:hypothetical protein
MPRIAKVLLTAAIALLLVSFVYAVLVYGPYSLRAEYNTDVARVTARAPSTPSVTEADLQPLPDPVRRYLRAAGVVGRPQVRNVFARMHGRFRAGPDSSWMPFVAEQYDALECCRGASRFFYMTASRALIPMQAYHRFADGAATMRVKVAGALTVLDLSGPEMTRAETVTLFNDLCVMAPAALVDAPVMWEQVEGDRVTAAYTNAGITVRADLIFDASGHLVDFVSDDRLKASDDGSTLMPSRWSTPLRGWKTFRGGVQLAAAGEARWHSESGAFSYIELELDDVAYDVRRP